MPGRTHCRFARRSSRHARFGVTALGWPFAPAPAKVNDLFISTTRHPRLQLRRQVNSCVEDYISRGKRGEGLIVLRLEVKMLISKENRKAIYEALFKGE